MTNNSLLIQNITAEDFYENIRLICREEYIALHHASGKKKLYTRKEASEELNISLPTLGEYVKQGLIKAKRIGNRILFTEEDIQTALKDIPSHKFQRR